MEGKGGLKELFFGFMDMLSKWMALSGLLLLGCLPVVTAGPPGPPPTTRRSRRCGGTEAASGAATGTASARI